MLVSEIKKRGLIFEKVGHSWISHAIGLHTEGWVVLQDPTVPEDISQYIAMVKGARKLWMGVPMLTQMCISNMTVQNKVIDYVCNYASQHPEIDILAFWLGDDINNWCECDECRKRHPSDWYVSMVNRLAAKLYEVAPAMKLEIIAYTNIMELPIEETLDNRYNNMIFMYAPGGRCYRHALTDAACFSDKPVITWPEINKLGGARNREFVEYIKGWLKKFEGDNYLFEYYNCYCASLDFFKTNIPLLIHKDLQSYSSLGVSGLVSCQSMKTFWPTGLAMAVLSQNAWDASVNLETIEDDYLQYAFNERYEYVKEYLHSLYDMLLHESDYSHSEYILNLEEYPAAIELMKEKKKLLLVEVNKCTDKVVAKRLNYLLTHLEFLIRMYSADMHISKGYDDKALPLLVEAENVINDNNSLLDPVCDIYEAKFNIVDDRRRKIDTNRNKAKV